VHILHVGLADCSFMKVAPESLPTVTEAKEAGVSPADDAPTDASSIKTWLPHQIRIKVSCSVS
jgi:hypothetical protein